LITCTVTSAYSLHS